MAMRCSKQAPADKQNPDCQTGQKQPSTTSLLKNLLQAIFVMLLVMVCVNYVTIYSKMPDKNDELRDMLQTASLFPNGTHFSLEELREVNVRGESLDGPPRPLLTFTIDKNTRSAADGAALGLDLSILDRAYAGKLDEVNEADMEFQWSEFTQAMTYGEIKSDGVLGMLVDARNHGVPLHGGRFYDLGSGAGKFTSIAWLAGMHATGVEIEEARWQHSCEALDRLKHDKEKPLHVGKGLDFLRADFKDIDVSDADLVYVDNVAFSEADNKVVARKFGRLTPGAHFISHVPIDHPNDMSGFFRQVSAVHTAETSFGRVPYLLYQKLASGPENVRANPGDDVRPIHAKGSWRCEMISGVHALLL